MDATKFLKEQARMCNSFEDCSKCPMGSNLVWTNNICANITDDKQFNKKVAIVEKWSKEHPTKTRLSEFMKQYPNAPINPVDKLPEIEPCLLDASIKERLCKGDFTCTECRERYWLENVE